MSFHYERAVITRPRSAIGTAESQKEKLLSVVFDSQSRSITLQKCCAAAQRLFGYFFFS
ncbi:MAG: hypothetical protein LBT46_01595 [Planctomycetaceae bacterium]|nr:hypothetical protein [Planctomycetaceae bacterium]